MATRSSPEEAGGRRRPRRIDAPAATSSQPEAQPQMAYFHNNGDDSGTQSTADADLGNSPCNPCGRETPPSPDCTRTFSGIIHYDSGWTPGAVFPRERLIVVGREHDDGRLAQWTHEMLSGRWTQSQHIDYDTGPRKGRDPVLRTPPGPPSVVPAAISFAAKKCPLSDDP